MNSSAHDIVFLLLLCLRRFDPSHGVLSSLVLNPLDDYSYISIKRENKIYKNQIHKYKL